MFLVCFLIQLTFDSADRHRFIYPLHPYDCATPEGYEKDSYRVIIAFRRRQMGDWKPRLSPYRPAALDRCGRFYRRRGPLSIYKNRLPSSTTLIHALFTLLVHPARLGAPAPSSFRPHQSQTNWSRLRGACTPRKGLAWPTEEDSLLVRLEEENITWSEAIRQFDQVFPGRISGSIKVRWSTDVSKQPSFLSKTA